MKTAIILAGGPSLTQEQIDAALTSGHFTLAINATYQKALTASAVYSGDYLFFKNYMADIRKRFKGEVWTQDNSASQTFNIKRMRGTNRDGLGKDCIYLNGNSGTQGLNLAYLWGYRKILLLGFDMKLGPKGERHHHADHPKPMVQNQTFGEWMLKMARVAKDLKTEKCLVVNCSMGSAMTCFPKIELEKCL